LQVTTQTR